MTMDARRRGAEVGAASETRLRAEVGAKLGRYQLGQELGRGATGVVYEAWDDQSRSVVALKTLTGMDAENLFRLKHEFRSLANLEHENFVRFGELGCEGGRWFFTMERVQGVDWLAYARPAVAPSGYDEVRLRAALVQLVEGLAALHDAGRIHRDVKPSNVLVSSEGRVVLLDFGLAAAMGAWAEMSGTPLYMAPEQIGCEVLTAAADWYAVGVMLHMALTGSAPFEQTDLAELMTAKLREEAPHGWGGAAPQDLVSLATALLSREASARPGVDEIRKRLGLAAPSAQVPSVFVGRQRELGALGAALERAKTQATQVVVRGEPGMGKSALVEHFLSDLPGQSVVLRGRCYEQESVPFGGADSLMDALSEYLVGLDSSEVDRLLVGGASEAATLFPVLCRVPSMSMQRGDAPMLNPTRLREQAFAELARLAQALGAVRTLVVYVDDLQWVDPDSMALMQAVFVGGCARCLFVATQRSGNGGAAGGVESFARDFEVIDVTSLGAEESQALCAALTTTANEATLATVLQESGGHPLFLSELVRSARMGKLALHANARLEDVLWDRVSERDEIERRFLRMAALAGAPTPYAVIAQAAGLDVGECLTRLSALRAAQLVRVSREGEARCVEPYHERIREAVMERLRAEGEASLEEAHLALGRTLLRLTPEGALSSRIFAVVQHLNAGRARIRADAERRDLAELAARASREAYQATAFAQASEYARIGIECTSASAGPIWRELSIVRLKAEYHLGRPESAQATFEAAKAQLEPVDAAPVYCALIDCLAANEPARGLALAREALERLGFPLPRRTTKAHIVREFLAARAAQGLRRPEDLEALPELEDPRIAAAMQLMTSSTPPAFTIDENLMPWIMLRLTRWSIRYGLSAASAFGFSGYGFFFTAALQRYETGAAFGELAMRLDRRFPNHALSARVRFVRALFLVPWVAPLSTAAEEMKTAYEVAVRIGDTTFECFAATALCFISFSKAPDLARYVEETEWARAVCEQRAAVTQTFLVGILERYLAALRGLTPSLQDLTLPGAPFEELQSLLRGKSDKLALLIFCLTHADLAYFARDTATMRVRIEEATKYLHVAFGHQLSFEYQFLRVLLDARTLDAPSSVFGRVVGALRLARDAGTFFRFRPTFQANAAPQAHVVAAELLRAVGLTGATLRRYDRAVDAAVKYGAPKREAIAAERASELARAVGDDARADGYRRRAVDAYRRWGATAKADLLEAEGRDRTSRRAR